LRGALLNQHFVRENQHLAFQAPLGVYADPADSRATLTE
jgi:hypothetical protein